jgi:hypothetical protein
MKCRRKPDVGSSLAAQVSNELESRCLRANIGHDIFNSHVTGNGIDRPTRPSDHRPVFAGVCVWQASDTRQISTAMLMAL